MWEFLAAEVTVCQPAMHWDGLRHCPLWDAFQRISITSQESAGKVCWGKDTFLNQCYSCPAIMSGLLSQIYEEVQSVSVYQSVSFGEEREGCAGFTIVSQGGVLRVQYQLL